MNMENTLILGIDIGTTSVKTVILNPSSKSILHSTTCPTKADILAQDTNTSSYKRNEQDVGKILKALSTCMKSASATDLTRFVSKVGITGQMHGLLLWSQQPELPTQQKQNNYVSHLFTWQDKRSSAEFLANLPVPNGEPVASGYGCVTLFWFKEYEPQFLDNFTCAGTIQDFVVCALCGFKQTRMSFQNAASWGFYDPTTNNWESEKLQSAGFPVHFLPPLTRPGQRVGSLVNDWFGIPKGSQVGVAMGDLQCAVLASCEEKTDAVLNISTSAQLAVLLSPDYHSKRSSIPSVQFVPFFDDHHLAVAASLNGGNVLANFIATLQRWMQQLGLNVPSQDDLWSKITSLDLLTEDDSAVALDVEATLFGERHSPNQFASIANIHSSNVSLGVVFRALCRGIITNLRTMMPQNILAEAGTKRLIATGSALSRNSVLQAELNQQFQSLPIVYRSGTDSAIGAALAMINSKKLTSDLLY